MRRRTAIVFTAALALAGGALAAMTSTAGSAGAAETRHWLVVCNVARTAADDPIVLPGKPGASHLHEFAGNKGISANSTAASLAGVASTCPNLDRSAYWVPTLYQNGKRVAPSWISTYYENRSMNAGKIHAFPVGFKMLLGNSTATTAAQTETRWVWGCTDNTQIGGQTPPTNCGSGGIQLRSQWPNCWDGVLPADGNATGHVRFSSGGNCPAGYQTPLPTLRTNVGYLLGKTTGTITLASGGGSVYSKHGDFFNGWDQATLQNLVDKCLNADGNAGCGTMRGTTSGTAGPKAGTEATGASGSSGSTTGGTTGGGVTVPVPTSTTKPASGPTTKPATTTPTAPPATTGTRHWRHHRRPPVTVGSRTPSPSPSRINARLMDYATGTPQHRAASIGGLALVTIAALGGGLAISRRRRSGRRAHRV